MKKYILLAFVTLLTWSAATAQKWYITPQIGINLSDLQGSDKHDYFNTTTGFVGGVEVERRLNDRLGISLGGFYSIKGGNPNITYVNIETRENVKVIDYQEHCKQIKLSYLSLPLLVNFHLWKGLTLKGGIQYSHNIRAREKRQGEGYISPLINSDFDKVSYADHNIENLFYRGKKPQAPTSDNMPDPERIDGHSTKGIKSYIHAADIAIPLGISYEYKHIVLDVRYQIGLTKVFRQWNSELDAGGEDNIRNACTSITIGYRFGL